MQEIILLTAPNTITAEHQQVEMLFQAGLSRLHLRKPAFDGVAYRTWLVALPQLYRKQVILHHHHTLAFELGLGGIHLTEAHKAVHTATQLRELRKRCDLNGMSLSAAIHDLDDLKQYGNYCDYVLVSPVFDSISKPNYRANTALDTRPFLGKYTCQLIALGGITATTAPQAKAMGFDGVAALGYIWNTSTPPQEQYMQLLDAMELK